MFEILGVKVSAMIEAEIEASLGFQESKRDSVRCKISRRKNWIDTLNLFSLKPCPRFQQIIN